jgi:UDP-glucose 4-epimerase
LEGVAMNVLITGGAGFIGSHLAEALLERGDAVCVIDNLSTGRLENVQHLQVNPKFSLVVDTIMNENIMRELIDQSEIVFHLAAAVGVKYIIDNPLASLLTNIRGTEIILRLANSNGKKKVILVSTSEVYGKNGKVPFKENDDRVLGSVYSTRWGYSMSKAVDEFLALAYWRERSLPTASVRLFNTCGPRQTGRYGMVLPRFVRSALLREPLTVYGDGTQTRCFTYVGDVIEALIGLAEKDEAVGEVFNIGSSQEVSIRELAERVIGLTGSDSEIKYISYEEAYGSGFEDMKRRIPDISKIRDLIGWTPKVDLDELLMIVINYYRSRQVLSESVQENLPKYLERPVPDLILSQRQAESSLVKVA